MKRTLLLLIAVMATCGSTYSQNYSWITPNKTYLKMYVVQDGMHRIERSDFTNAGINTSVIDPRTVKVFNNGNQIPIFFSGQQDGSFDASDFFDFYGQRNYGGPTKVYDHLNNVAYTLNEYYNQYSDTNVYWIDWGGANGIRYTDVSFSTPTPFSSSSFSDFAHMERDYFYSQGENFSSTDLRFLTSEKYRAEGWLWSSLGNTASLSDTFSLPLLSPVTHNAGFRVLAYPTQRNTSVTNEHTLELRVNNNLVATLLSNDANRFDSTVTFSSSLLTTGVNTVSVRYSYSASFTSSLNVDLMRVNYQRRFALRNGSMSAVLGGSDTASRRFSVTLANSAQPVSIYDVLGSKRITVFSFSADTLTFTASNNASLEVNNGNIMRKPFRIKQKQVPDLVASSNGADYLVIYNKLFESQAEQLRAYRQNRDSFRAFKAEIEDIYDIFNFGIESPSAVRNFTKHVYDNWQSPRMSYICLFGRGSLDPKKLLSTSSYYQNLLPVYGYPPTDGYFGNFNIGTFCYFHMVPVGRIPAYSASEAQNVVDKIISYEAQPFADWSKNYIYVTGGGTRTEQVSHQSKSNVDILTLISPPSLSGDPVKVYRTDSSGYTSYNVMDSLINSIDRGSVYVNYRGHAGSHDWEISLNDANRINNGTRLPLILSLTCFTGENSLSDFRGFGEQFTYLPGKGSIGFIGTTGWSYAQNGNDYGTHITTTIKNDTARRIGKINQYAHLRMNRDSLSFAIRHTLNCYSLLGDPAAELRIPKVPEFSISQSDYDLSNPFPSIGENVTLTVTPHNFGLHADSVKVRFLVKKDNINYRTQDMVSYGLGQSDTLAFSFLLDSLGNYDISVILDQDNWVPLEDKSNNVLNISLPTKNTSYLPIGPVTNSVIGTDSVTFTGLNPRVPVSGNSIRVILQVDTSLSFNSPKLVTFSSNNISGVSTSFSTLVPVRINNTIHFWRTNAVINNDTTGWSSAQNFIYNTGTFARESRETDNQLSPLSVNILKNRSVQFPKSDLANTVFKASGLELQDYQATMFVRSYGSNAEEASYFSVGNKNVYIDGGKNTGLNVLKVKKLNGSIMEMKNLKMNTPASNDSLVNYLNTYDSTHYLMLLNAAYFAGGQNLSTASKNKLRQFGSVYCDSIGLISYFHTWSLIGWLGAAPAQVSEMFDPCCRPAPGCVSCDHWTESVSSLNVTFRQPSGTASNIVGPAKSWTGFSWTQNVPANSSIKFDVYGIDANDNQQYLLYADVTSNTFTDLGLVNAIRYPRLNFVAKLNMDTLLGKLSPSLASISVSYIPAAELVWDVNVLELNSTYKIGEELKFSTYVHNLGYSDIPGLIVNIFKKSATQENLIKSDTSLVALQRGASAILSRKFVIPYFRDSMNAIVQIKLYDRNNEFHTFNNEIRIPLKSLRLYRPVAVRVYSDGALINPGDPVAKNPEIRIESSESEGIISSLPDTMRISVSLNDKYVPYYVNGTSNPLFKSVERDAGGPGNFTFYPELNTGLNSMQIIVRTETDNADTVYFDVNVSDEFAVTDLYNFPNPMKERTDFVFSVSGSEQPENVKIRIYTVGGRLVKEIISPANIGSNSVPWDGRDNDGDLIANGTYIYRLVISDGASSKGVDQKLVILR